MSKMRTIRTIFQCWFLCTVFLVLAVLIWLALYDRIFPHFFGLNSSPLSYQNTQSHSLDTSSSVYVTSEKVGHVVTGSQTKTTSSQCPQLRRPAMDLQEIGHFQPVDGQRKSAVFSAFHDERDGVVRVIGITNRAQPPQVRCHLWYDVTDGATSQELVVTPATTEILGQNQGLELSAAYFHCPLPQRPTTTTTTTNSTSYLLPYAVSVTSLDCRNNVTAPPPTNVLKVVTSPNRPKDGSKVDNFTVCVKPVWLHYGRAHEVVEFIEMNRLLGASKFHVYLLDAARNVRRVLRWYRDQQGVVETTEWPIVRDMEIEVGTASSRGDVHKLGQVASNNDCLHRYRHTSRYVVFADWDEILLPKKHSGWMPLIQATNRQHGGRNYSEYSFACLFFRKDFPPKTEDFPGRDKALKYRSNLLLINKRAKKKTSPYLHSAKYIADPEKVHVAGIHTSLKYRHGNWTTERLRLEEGEGLNLHYRDMGGHKYATSVWVQDDLMHRFKDALLERLEKVWSQLPGVPLN